MAWQQVATSSFCLQEDSAGLYLDKNESHYFFTHFCLESKVATLKLIINAFFGHSSTLSENQTLKVPILAAIWPFD